MSGAGGGQPQSQTATLDEFVARVVVPALVDRFLRERREAAAPTKPTEPADSPRPAKAA